MEPDDLLNLVRAGDVLAWEAFVRRFHGRVFGLAYHYLGNAEACRDLAQDVFVKIYSHRSEVPPSGGCLAWILCITRNACLDHRRRAQARPPLWDLPAETMFDLGSTEPGPFEAHVSAARKAAVHRALRELTALNREVLLLKEVHGLEVEAIAALLEVPVGTVKSRAFRARLELAGKLAAMGVGA